MDEFFDDVMRCTKSGWRRPSMWHEFWCRIPLSNCFETGTDHWWVSKIHSQIPPRKGHFSEVEVMKSKILLHWNTFQSCCNLQEKLQSNWVEQLLRGDWKALNSSSQSHSRRIQNTFCKLQSNDCNETEKIQSGWSEWMDEKRLMVWAFYLFRVCKKTMLEPQPMK